MNPMLHRQPVSTLFASTASGPAILIPCNTDATPNSSPQTGYGERSPIIYSRVRTLQGVIESRHYYSLPSISVYDLAPELGPHAARYLIAHGYTHSAIDTIIQVCANVASAEDFALELSPHGLALAEGVYLWRLIHI